MTSYTVKTTRAEADAIVKGDKMFVLRADSPMYAVGNRITFSVIEKQKLIAHPIENRIYEITYIESGDPIRSGVLLIGFRNAV